MTHVSTHCSLREAIERVRADRVLDVIRLTHERCGASSTAPRIAVCGLNPHAGEHGLFGSEDAEHIAPGDRRCGRRRGIDASGPHPADTVFFQAVHRNRYDAIVVMYHDQGHAPMKLLAFDTGVNVTLGLPIIRTSVDHGTAFDIAWTGRGVHRLADAHARDCPPADRVLTVGRSDRGSGTGAPASRWYAARCIKSGSIGRPVGPATWATPPRCLPSPSASAGRTCGRLAGKPACWPLAMLTEATTSTTGARGTR